MEFWIFGRFVQNYFVMNCRKFEYNRLTFEKNIREELMVQILCDTVYIHNKESCIHTHTHTYTHTHKHKQTKKHERAYTHFHTHLYTHTHTQTHTHTHTQHTHTHTHIYTHIHTQKHTLLYNTGAAAVCMNKSRRGRRASRVSILLVYLYQNYFGRCREKY